MKQKHTSHSKTHPATNSRATRFAPVKNFILATIVVALCLFPTGISAAPPPPKQKKETATIDTKAITAVSFDISKESANHWTRRVKLTFDNSAQTETLQDFPVLVALNATRINYNDTQDQGQDLRFVDADGTTLPYEIEQWNESGTSYVWVKIPQIDGSSTTDYIWLYYGNAVAPAGQNAPAVWSNNYRMVYHLHENPDLQAGVVHESTAYAFHASNQNSTDSSGYIANGQTFNGFSQYINLGSDLPVLNNVSAATLSAWAWSDSSDGDVIGIARNNGGLPVGNSRASIAQESNRLRIYARTLDDDSDYNTTATDASNFTAGTWHYVVAVIDYANDHVDFYIDGVAQAWTDSLDFTATSTANTNSANGAIGSNDDGGGSYFDGVLDEVRVAAGTRSADWVAAQHLSMNDTFISYTAAEPLNIKLGDDIIGAPFTYELTITNTGNTAATNVVVSDTLPNGANYISGGSYLPVADAVEWTIANIAPNNGTAQVTYSISTCQASLLNAAYRVVTSTQGVASSLGPELITILQPPTISSDFSYSPVSPTIAAPVTFTGTHTSDGGAISSWQWDFGDSGAASSQTAQHIYTAQGNYDVRLTITDTCGYTASTTKTLSVSGNLAPLGVNDQTTVVEGGTVITLTGNYTSVLHNDSDPNGDPLSISTTPQSGPSYGALTLYSNGTFSYTHDGSENHSDIFTYTVHDGILSDTATVNIIVNPVNDPPSINPTGDPSVDEAATLAFTATANDSDLPADTLTFSLEPGAPTGASINSAGNFSWTPTEAQGPGVYPLTLRVSDDGSPPLSGTHTLTITVNEVNSAPALATITDKITAGGVEITFTATFSDSDLPANNITFTLEPGAPIGASIGNSSGLFAWTPTLAQAPGIYPISVRVTDDGSPPLSDVQTFTITVNEINSAPLANDDVTATNEDTAVYISVLDNDSDPQLDPLTVTLGTPASFGLTSHDDSSFTYTPTLNFYGQDSFTYIVSDGALTDTATVSITINPINDPPTISDIPDRSTDIDTPLGPLTFSIGDVETPATALTLLITSSNTTLIPPSNISTGGSGITRAMTLTPALGLTGTTTISVTVDDGTDQTLETFNVQVQMPPIYHIYLPVILKGGPASDLIVETIIANSNDIQVVIKNIGSAPVRDNAFWVDVYINPITVPTTVNQTWNHMGDQGLVWSVLVDALPLKTGESLTLTTASPYYWESLSNVTWPLPVGSWVYAQVDSADINTNYGAILESHEIVNGDYNNISVIQSLATQNDAFTARAPTTQTQELEAVPDLPSRP